LNIFNQPHIIYVTKRKKEHLIFSFIHSYYICNQMTDSHIFKREEVRVEVQTINSGIILFLQLSTELCLQDTFQFICISFFITIPTYSYIFHFQNMRKDSTEKLSVIWQQPMKMSHE